MATPHALKHNPAVTSPFNLFLLGLLGVVGVAYVLIGSITRDFLWFWPVFSQQPSEIILHCYGNEIPLAQDSPYFLPLTYRVEQQISGEKRLDDVDFSLEVYNQLKSSRTKASLEIHFSRPVRIHSHRSYFTDVDTLLYVVGGDKERWVSIYGLKDGQPVAGRLRIAGTPMVADYLSQEKLCAGPYEGK
ncbi:MAG: hypothetical protein ACOYYS_23825 [Chloroflexota bacterium]